MHGMGSSIYSRLAFGVLTGSALLIGGIMTLHENTTTLDAEAAAPSAGSVPHSASHPHALQTGSKLAAFPLTKSKAKKDSARNVSDMLAMDFRTIGACDCPPLPARAPRWLHAQVADPEFQYRDLGTVLDTTGHLLYDGLGGDRRLSEVYYFCEKILTTPNNNGSASNGAHTQPHLPPSLDFEPQTPAGGVKSIVVAPSATSWFSTIASFLPSFLRPSSAEAEPASSARSGGSQKPLATAAHLTPTGPEVRAIFHVGDALCGHRGIVHGGMTAALIDEVSGAATFCAAGPGQFTANLNINYVKPVYADAYLLVRAQAVKQEGRKTWVNISVEDGEGGTFARGTALYVKPKMLPAAVMVAATQ